MAVKKGGAKAGNAASKAGQTVMQRDAQGRMSRVPGALTPQQGRVARRVAVDGMPIEEACQREGFADPWAEAAALSKNVAFQETIERRQKREMSAILSAGTKKLGAIVRADETESGEIIRIVRMILPFVMSQAKATEGDQAHGLEGLTIDKLDAAMQALKQANGDAALTIEALPDSIDDAPNLDDE